MAKKTNKDKFIEEILTLVTSDGGPTLSEEAWEFFEELRNGKASIGGLTEVGEKILLWVRDNTTKNCVLFSAKAIGEGLFLPPRSVSGAARKLVADGYLTKEGQNPVSYSITQEGRKILPEVQ